MKLDYNTICSFAQGVEYTEIKNDKIVFSRFSREERQSLNYGTDESFATAGVRIEFETDSEWIDISTSVENSNSHGRNFYSFDVYCNGNIIGQIKNFDMEPQYPYIEYKLNDENKLFKLPIGLKRICIYFPWSVQGMIREIEIDDSAVVQSVTKERKIIMYGDSITQGYDAAYPSLSYASRLIDLLNANGINKGIAGSVFMPELTKSKTTFSADVIMVAYGTNDWNGSDFESFKDRCNIFFDNLYHNYPQIPIVAISPIWRADSDEKRKFGDFSKVAETIRIITKQYKNIVYINGIDFIPKNTLYYRDSYLHPNDEGFGFFTNSLIEKINNTFIERV